jgi:hypothetical protein
MNSAYKKAGKKKVRREAGARWVAGAFWMGSAHVRGRFF